MIFQANNLRKLVLLFSGVLVGVGFLGTLVFIWQSARTNQKNFEDLSAPPLAAAPEVPSPSSSSPTAMPVFDMPDFLQSPKTSVTNRNVQLKKDPTEEDIKAYIAEVERVAVSASSVTIDGCEPEPVVVRIAASANLLFVNNDAATHLITVEDKKFAIEAHKSREVPMSFASGTGIYNYDCDSHFSVGTLWVE